MRDYYINNSGDTMQMALAYTLAYYNMTTITTVKGFKVQVPGSALVVLRITSTASLLSL